MKFKANQRILNGMLMKEIKDLNATIRRHGEAHLAQDLLPQFTELVKKVEKLEGVLNFKLNDGPIHNHSVRIAELEKLVALVAHHTNKISDVEECNSAHYERLCDIEEFDKTVLKSIPDIEILKTQVAGLENSNRILTMEAFAWREANKDIAVINERLNNSPFSKIVMEEYAENIKRLVRDVDTLKIQQENTSPRLKALMDEVIRQKAFLSKVQAILDRERDARLVNSPSHKKELEALKMDKHVDMMVKKGRPRKP